MSGALAAQHALVTGGGTGIGAATAQRLHQAGARITLLGRRRAVLEQALTEFGSAAPGSLGVVVADVTDETAVRNAFTGARAARGPITILVNNAGQAESMPAAKMSLEHWNATLGVNLTGVFLCSREFITFLPKDTPGRIVNIASTAGLKGYGYVSAYCAAKHGVIGYTRALAAELARRPVTVNAVCPGYTETAILDGAVAKIAKLTGRTEAEARDELAHTNPQHRFVQAGDVAATVLWLCLPESDAITGIAVPVAGGEV